MKFTPRQLSVNVNVSKTHPLVELFWLLGGLILITGAAFLLLGLATDWAASKAPVSVENWLGAKAIGEFPAEQNPSLQQLLDKLLEQVPADSKLHQYDFRIFLSDSEEVNAVALPGGNIVIFGGLLKEIDSENELSMIIAHELGHFAHRDHLRGLGRGLGLTVASILLFGEDNSATNLISSTLMTFQLRYSQSQESAADQFALDLLAKRYGHIGGSTDFFQRLTKEAGSRIPYLLASHPHPQARIDKLEKHIRQNNYSTREVVPLAESLMISDMEESEEGQEE